MRDPYLYEDPSTLNFELGWQSFVRNSGFFTVEEKKALFSNVSANRIVEISNIIFKPQGATVVVLCSTSNLTEQKIECIVNEGLA